MDLEKLEAKLIQAARNQPVSSHVPFAFEKRIMARLGAVRSMDLAAFWARSLWRAAAVCLAVSVLLSLWSFTSHGSSETITLESTVLSMAEQLSDNW